MVTAMTKRSPYDPEPDAEDGRLPYSEHQLRKWNERFSQRMERQIRERERNKQEDQG
jgi:hypothetical protein